MIIHLLDPSRHMAEIRVLDRFLPKEDTIDPTRRDTNAALIGREIRLDESMITKRMRRDREVVVPSTIESIDARTRKRGTDLVEEPVTRRWSDM